MAQMTPHSAPGYPGRPRVTAADLRYEWEIASNVGTIVIGLLLLVLVGQFVNILFAAAIPIAFSLLMLFFTNLTNKGSMVQVSQVQFPHLHQMSLDVAHNLDMEMPAIFVKQSPVINAFATGLFGQRTVVLHSALLEQLSNEEVKAVIAHEFGHIKLNHIMYGILQNIAVSGFLGNAIFTPIRWLFFFASRAAEYSADQAALVGTMNIQACVTSEIKLAVGAKLYEQMNIQAYLMQMEEFSHSTGSKFIEILHDRTHPMTVNRILHVIRYYRSEKYQRLAAQQGRAGTTTLTSGQVGTRDLFQRVAAKAEYDRDVQRASQGVAQQQQYQQPQYQAPQPPAYQQPQYQAPQPPQYQTPPPAPAYAQTPPAVPVYQPAPSAVTPPSLSCGSCGIPLDAHARFCVRCGSPVAGAGASPVAQPVVEAAQPAQPEAARVVRRVVRPVGDAPVAQQAAPVAPPIEAAPVPQPPTPAPVATACSGCGSALEPDTRFCPNCGQPAK